MDTASKKNAAILDPGRHLERRLSRGKARRFSPEPWPLKATNENYVSSKIEEVLWIFMLQLRVCLSLARPSFFFSCLEMALLWNLVAVRG